MRTEARGSLSTPRGSNTSAENSAFARVICAVLPLLFSLTCLSCLSARPAYAGKDRVALVMVVEAYSHFTKSIVTSDTTQKMGEILRKRGFDVTVVKDPNNAVARAKLREFAQEAVDANVAIAVLAGHGVSSRGRTYLLPSNAEIVRDSDLLSRGLALPSVVRIVGRAKTGAVFFLMTAADIPSTLQSVSARPVLSGEVGENVVVVFSTSDKVPVSRVDKVTAQAAADFVDALSETPLLAKGLVDAAAAGGIGKVFGNVPDIDLSKAPEPPAASARSPEAASREAAAIREAEQRAREAEERARQLEARAREAEERARAEKREAEARAREAVQRAQEEAQRAKKAEDETLARSTQPDTSESQAPAANIESLKIIEALFGRAKRKQIQYQLKKRGLYVGQIDAIFGDLTRQAIRGYQSSLGDDQTGYLTPQQLQSLEE